MFREMHRARWAVAAAAASGLLLVPGCTSFKDQLLQPQNPGIIDNSAVGSPAAAAALKIGAMGRIKVVYTSSETLWQEAGQVADEYQNADFQPDRNDVDQRTMATNSPYANYTSVTQTRGYIRDAIGAETKYEPTKNVDIGELWMALGFIEMSLGENFCNGIPLGNNVNGAVDYTLPSFKPLTNNEVFNVAIAHMDSAITLIGGGSDSSSLFVKRAALVLKARMLVDQGQYAAAAALVPASVVPTTWQYLFTTSAASTSDDNGIWTLNNSVSRVTVGDSVMTYQGKTFFIANAIPFFTLNDPRVPVVTGASQKLVAEDGLTPLYLQQIWKNRDDAVALAAGIDARMIEAEAKLNANDIAGMMTILNAVRAAPPRLGGVLQPAAMPALPTPATQDAATSLFFREKAFWQFSRGFRLSDLRRLVRQYKRTQDKVFPSGQHYKGGNYGSDVNFPVPDGELVNPQFHGCIDRNA